jgi:glycosyltransferase involved in cell wall biosynthesis
MSRVLFLVADGGAVSTRFRVSQYVPALRAAGVDPTVVDLRRALPARLRALASAARFDAVVVHRALLSPFELWWLRRSAGGFAFDFDDALPFRDSAARRLASRLRWRRFARMARHAALSVAGNEYLADLARAGGGRRVEVVPSVVDLSPYPAAADGTGGAPIVGWMGTKPNLMYLRPVLPALRAAARRSRARVAIVSDAAAEVAADDVEWKRWSAADEVGDLCRFRVGVMPLVDDAWTRGKCGLKILQYFAAFTPVVCAPVGVNRTLVAEGENGYFADTPEEWCERVAALLGDPARCRRFGACGRALVEARYSIAATLPAWLRILATLQGSAAATEPAGSAGR